MTKLIAQDPSISAATLQCFCEDFCCGFRLQSYVFALGLEGGFWINIDYVFGRGHGYMNALWVICTWCRRDFGDNVLGFGVWVICARWVSHYTLDRKTND